MVKIQNKRKLHHPNKGRVGRRGKLGGTFPRQVVETARRRAGGTRGWAAVSQPFALNTRYFYLSAGSENIYLIIARKTTFLMSKRNILRRYNHVATFTPTCNHGRS